MKVLFLILNYKTYQETIGLTEKLCEEGLIDKHVLIVDNASPNNSFEILRKQFDGYKNVEVIASPENGGFAKGNNFGLRYAKKYNPQYVCIINNDVLFSMATISKNNKETKREAMRRAKLHEEAYSTCVSCWTKHIEESIMFWNCYGQSTCKISSTIGKLINSIKPEPYPIIISPVQYNDKGRTEIIQDKVFSKHEAYADEQEIRLCVLYYEHHILLNIDVQTLIESITINPFFSKYYQQFIKDSLEEKYSFLNGRIKKSHLLEYKS